MKKDKEVIKSILVLLNSTRISLSKIMDLDTTSAEQQFLSLDQYMKIAYIDTVLASIVSELIKEVCYNG